MRALGGFSVAERWSLELEDGRRGFAKLATTKRLGHRLQAEYRNMLVVPQEFRCQVVGWRGTHPLLVVEDLSDARWPPPWQPGDVDRGRIIRGDLHGQVVARLVPVSKTAREREIDAWIAKGNELADRQISAPWFDR